MKTSLRPHLLLVLFLTTGSLQSHADSRHALVIGNDAYEHARGLANCRNDATAMAATLEQVGFDVVLRVDADLATTRGAVREFIDAVSAENPAETTALVYFAGHGVQIAGENYLIPVDAKMERDYEVPDETLALASIMRSLDSAGAGLNLLVLDCCRNNPFARSWRGSRSADSGGLAVPGSSPRGMFIAFSTSPGDVAEDGEGKNSPYTAALIKHLPSPGKEFESIFKLVGRDVSDLTDGNQEPWFRSKFYGNFSFVDESTPSDENDIPDRATKKKPWENSLGLEMIPVPGQPDILMARTETRVRDYRAFARATDLDASGGANVFRVRKKTNGGYTTEWVEDATASWENPGFIQSSNHPVSCVSWLDAQAFCAWLSQREGRHYRLPTDAEWSAAASTGARYGWGDEFPPTAPVGNFWDLEAIKNLPGTWTGSVFGGTPYNDGAERTAVVASYPANPKGFFDLAGNVWEWCAEPYRASLNDPALVAANEILREETDENGVPHRILRGASWDNFVESDLRIDFRDFDGPTRRDDDYGFRIVLELD